MSSPAKKVTPRSSTIEFSVVKTPAFSRGTSSKYLKMAEELKSLEAGKSISIPVPNEKATKFDGFRANIQQNLKRLNMSVMTNKHVDEKSGKTMLVLTPGSRKKSGTKAVASKKN